MQVAVWAPRATGSVEVVTHDDRVALRPMEHGWWRGEVAGLVTGSDYAFSLDGGPPRADPRSAWQPHGPEGPSRVVDHDAFPWTDDGWDGIDLASAVLYELHVGTFSPEGTFDGAIGHLDHLVELGVDAIEIMPVVEFSGRRGWGYDGVDLWAPHSAYGGPDGLKRLVDAAHARDLGVIIDVVYNHVGPSGNHLSDFGPYLTDSHHTRWGPGLNLDGPGSDEVRVFVIDNALMWLRDVHADGLRLDAVDTLVDRSAVSVLEELSVGVRELGERLGRPLWLIAEADQNDPRPVQSSAEGGDELDAVWADDWHHALHAVLTDERDGYYRDFGSLGALAKALRQAWVYDGVYSSYRGRTHGRPPDGLHGGQFVVSVQNHDQVGNRARGERLGHLVSLGRVKIAAALLSTSPFVPMLFQGEEWGASTPFRYFTDHDEVLGAAVAAGRRREFARFGWDAAEVPDSQDPDTFERSVLCWDEVTEPGHADLLSWYRALISLRTERPALSAGPLDDVRVRCDQVAGWLALERAAAGVAVALNLAATAQVVPVAGEVLLATDGVARHQPSAAAFDTTGAPVAGLVVPPDGVAIVAGGLAAEAAGTSNCDG